jgi:hypothetical protein
MSNWVAQLPTYFINSEGIKTIHEADASLAFAMQLQVSYIEHVGFTSVNFMLLFSIWGAGK